MSALAQALAPLAPVTPIRSRHRTESRRLAHNGAGHSGTGHAGRIALEIISNQDRARIISSAQSALYLVRGKWKIAILVQMIDRPVRLGQLRRLIPHASKKVLVQQLHELERDGIIVRTDLSLRVKHVEYAVSESLGTAMINLLEMLSEWRTIRARPDEGAFSD